MRGLSQQREGGAPGRRSIGGGTSQQLVRGMEERIGGSAGVRPGRCANHAVAVEEEATAGPPVGDSRDKAQRREEVGEMWQRAEGRGGARQLTLLSCSIYAEMGTGGGATPGLEKGGRRRWPV
jgi:hypothetical protein